MTHHPRFRTALRASLVASSLMLILAACGGSGSDEGEGLDREVAVPVVDPEQDPFAFLEIPRGVQTMVVGPLGDVFQVGEQLV